MSNHLKRLGDIFGSFVSTDFKRKRLQDETSFTQEKDTDESPPKRKKLSSTVDDGNEFTDVAAFLKRVASFTDLCWCRDVPQLSPLEIARHGWASTGDEFMVKCDSCGQHLSLALPSQDTGVRETCIKTAVARLFSAHGEFCPWGKTSSPAHLVRLEVPDLQNLTKTAERISQLGEKLPYLRSDHVTEWEDIVDTIKKQDGAFHNIEDDRIKTFSCVLALCGWREGMLEDTLTDQYSVRRIGVWNFVSIQDEDDIQETQRVAQEMGQSIDETSREFKPAGKEYLNPLDEHVSWHPILQPPPDKESLTTTRYIIKELEKARKPATSSASALMEKLHSKDSVRVIYKVRDLLDQW